MVQTVMIVLVPLLPLRILIPPCIIPVAVLWLVKITSKFTAPFATFSLISRYLSKSLGTTHVLVQEFALQVFCRHLYQYICFCQYFSLVPLDLQELCERGCTVPSNLRLRYSDTRVSP